MKPGAANSNSKMHLLSTKQMAEIIGLYELYSASKVARMFNQKHELKISEWIVYQVVEAMGIEKRKPTREA